MARINLLPWLGAKNANSNFSYFSRRVNYRWRRCFLADQYLNLN